MKLLFDTSRHCKFLEWSCHGIVWLATWLGFTYMIDDSRLYQLQINMFLSLILDCLFIAIIKAIVRRRRPTVDPYAMGPDVYSFPSGHASRSTMIFCFFIFLNPISFIFRPAIFAWTASICVSRLLLYRHHILDVVAGIFVGIFEALLMAIFWLNQDTCVSLMSWMTDEKISGPEV